MEKIRKKWSSMDLFGKCSYLSVGLLFFLIPFTGLVLESLNISIIKFEIILGIYVLSIICSILAKKWKLIIIATVGGITAMGNHNRYCRDFMVLSKVLVRYRYFISLKTNLCKKI